MKISFPNYDPGELLIKKQGVPYITSFIIICFFVGLCASYLLENKFWLLPIAVFGITGILLCLGGAAGIFLNCSKVDAAPGANSAPSANIGQNVPRITSQWDYRVKKPIRAPVVFDGPSTETSEVLSADSFAVDKIDDHVRCNDNSLEDAAPTLLTPDPMARNS